MREYEFALSTRFVSTVFLVVCLALAAAPARAANQTLVLEPNEGAVGSFLTATYEVPLGPRGACDVSGTVEFWWKTAGTPGGEQLGSKEMQSCKASERLQVPESTCDSHNIYAFRRNQTREPDPDTTASAVFTVVGCSAVPPSPPPAGGTTPKPGPKPTAGTTGPATETGPPVTEGAEEESGPQSTAGLEVPSEEDKPAIPPGKPPGGGPGLGALIPYVVLAALPIGAWVVGSILKFKPLAGGGIIKWGSLSLAVVAAGGSIGWGYLKAVKGTPKTVKFDYTGGIQNWKVPEGVSKATFSVVGARGGAGCGFTEHEELAVGGRGGRVSSNIAVSPGETLRVIVGGRGKSVTACGFGGGGQGGFNGGGDGGKSVDNQNGGGGGGASDVRRSPYGIGNRIIVGGGGGGGGNFTTYIGACDKPVRGGFGGGQTGGVGDPSAYAMAGGGGDSNSGGEGGDVGGAVAGIGVAATPGGDGSIGTGGVGGSFVFKPSNSVIALAGGGGGGGWYGGGGGGSANFPCSGAGGGGSGRGPPGAEHFAGVNFDDGYVVLQYTQYSTLF